MYSIVDVWHYAQVSLQEQPPHLQSLTQITVVALSLVALEAMLACGPVGNWLNAAFAPKVSDKQMPQTLWGATCRIIGLLHLLVQLPVAVGVLCCAGLAADPFSAVNRLSQFMVVVSSGYFLYDIIVCSTRNEGLQYLVHALVCGGAYTTAVFTGKLHYWGAVFLLWECSTPFVYGRWFLYKMGKESSPLYIINGVLLLLVFFCTRNVFGTYMGINFVSQVWVRIQTGNLDGFSPFYLGSYSVGCLCLVSLNFLWFTKMIQGALQITRTGKSDKQE